MLQEEAPDPVIAGIYSCTVLPVFRRPEVPAGAAVKMLDVQQRVVISPTPPP